MSANALPTGDEARRLELAHLYVTAPVRMNTGRRGPPGQPSSHAAIGGVSCNANEFFLVADAYRGHERHFAVLIHIYQSRHELCRRLAQRVHEALEARLGAEAHDEIALACGVIAADRADAIFDIACHPGFARPGWR